MSDVKNESATKLDEGAAKLDEGAARLNEGAAKLHEVALQLREEASEPASWSLSAATRAQLERARTLLLHHPLRAVATIAVVAAFVEVELAVGVLAGLGATALLTTRSGPATRERFALRGRIAIHRARIAIARRRAKRLTRSSSAREPAAAAPPA